MQQRKHSEKGILKAVSGRLWGSTDYKELL
jgi:hypothetical protein